MTQSKLSRQGFAAGLILHTVAVLAVWQGWAGGSRGLWLTWMDFPLSLAWLGARGRELLVWTLCVGGLWWGLLTAGLVFFVGRFSSRQGL